MSATQDKATSGFTKCSNENPSALVAVGNMSTGRIHNILDVIDKNYNDDTSGPTKSVEICTRESPIGDANYANLPIGSKCFRDRVASKVFTGAEIYIKKAAGANGWEPLVTQSEAGQHYVAQKAYDDGDATVTAQELLDGEGKMTPTAGRALTLPAASALLALMPNAKIGTTILWVVMNLAAATHAITVTASSSITNGGRSADFTVAAAATARYRVRFTNVTSGSEAAVLVRC